MNHSKFLIIGLVILCLKCQNTTNTTNTTTVNNCAPSAALTAFGFTPQTAAVSTGVCTSYFNVTGACVVPTGVSSFLATKYITWANIAQNAYNFTGLYLAANLYFYNINNNSTNAINSSSGFWASIGNWFVNLWSQITNLYNLVLNWVQNLFTANSNAINPCFQAYVNITNGLFCVFTANSNNTATAVPSTTNVWSFLADPNVSTGLDSCLPLIDNYCILNYGVSITRTNLPFNVTMNWSDGAITNATCNSLQALNGATNATATLQRRSIILNTVRTDAVPFVWSSANILALGNFLNASPLTQPSTFSPTAFSSTGPRLQFSPLAGITTDFIAAGVSSGQPNGNYTAINSALINGFSLMVLLFLTIFMKF